MGPGCWAIQIWTDAGCCGHLSQSDVLLYKVSFYTHRVVVLFAVSMTLLLSHEVLIPARFETRRVESKVLEHPGQSSLVWVGAGDQLGHFTNSIAGMLFNPLRIKKPWGTPSPLFVVCITIIFIKTTTNN